MPTRKEIHEQLLEKMGDLSASQAEVFKDSLDEEIDRAFDRAHQKAKASNPEELRQQYEAAFAKVRRGSHEAFELRRKYRAMGLKI